jgi:HEAT repeat protein
MLMTVLVKPFARTGNTPLYALLISLCWVPVYVAGLLAPSRALVQLLHELLPYMPYNIGITGIENPRVMAYLDVAVGLAGVVSAVLATYIDSTWRSRQASQVELLPTSRARSAAIGLVELQGVARPVPPNSKGPILNYNSRHPDPKAKQPFYLEDETGRILIDPRESKFRTRWLTSFGGRITETVLKSREQLPDLTAPHVMALHPGDPVYVIGTAQPNPDAPPDAVDSEKLIVSRRKSGFFSTPLWQLSQGKIRPKHAAEDIFFLTDSKEEVARRRIMKGLWQIWAWAFLWIAMSLAMFHFQLPRTREGYDLWSMPEIIKYAAPEDRLEAVLDFFERSATRTENRSTPLPRGLKDIPLLGAFLQQVNANLQHAQRTEGVNYLWSRHFKDASPEEVQLLVKSAASSIDDIRWWAVARLGEATAYPDLVIPILIHALEHDPVLSVREYAASNLLPFREAAFPAIPALVEAARSPEYKLRGKAIWTLTRFNGIPDGPAHDLFLEMVEDEADWVRQAGVQGLRNMAGHTGNDVQVLLELTRDPDHYTRSLSLKALAMIAPDAAGYYDAVVRALHDEEELVRQSAVHALADFAIIPDEAADPLGAMISNKSLSGRILSLLVKMQERAAPAVPYLAEALESKDGKVAYNAAFALSRIGEGAAPAVVEMTAALNHKDKFVRRYCAQALGNSGSAAIDAIPDLIKLHKDPDTYVRTAARHSISQISSDR